MPRRSAAARARQRVAEDGAAVVEMQGPGLAERAKAAAGSGAGAGASEFGDVRVRLALALPRSLTEAQQREVDRLFPATPEELRAAARAEAVMMRAREGGGEEQPTPLGDDE
jgi:hypothetical protein